HANHRVRHDPPRKHSPRAARRGDRHIGRQARATAAGRGERITMEKEIIDELMAGFNNAYDALKRELGKVRTGRANPAILDNIRVEYYGTQTPINQMAAVQVPDARLITIKPWDKSALKQIEQALVAADIGITPQNDGEIIRLPIPALTEER